MLYSGGTAIGNAILHGVRSINENAFAGRRQVIDISGDGPDRDGLPAYLGRDRAISEGMTVNGLPILEGFEDLGQFFRDNVFGGPGAFAVPATSFADFATAVRLKLIREIAGHGLPVHFRFLASGQHGGAAQFPLAQPRQSFVGRSQRKNFDLGLDRHARRQFEEFLGVGAGQVGDRTQHPLAPQ